MTRAAVIAFAIGALLAGAAHAREATPTSSMIEAALTGDAQQLDRALLRVKAEAKPPRGDRRAARELNDQGLAYWHRQRFPEAAAVFKQASAADPSDAEVAENLGYALLKSGEVTGAERALLAALTLAPDRASAWGSLGLAYAKQGKPREGIACVLTAYRFARDKKRTLDVYSRLARADEDPRVRAMLTEVVGRLSGAQPSPS